MAMRSVVQSRAVLSQALMTRSIGRGGGATRYFSDGKGKVLSEEERAAENIYIQKMERERLEKQRLKAEKEKAKKENENVDKKTDGTH